MKALRRCFRLGWVLLSAITSLLSASVFAQQTELSASTIATEIPMTVLQAKEILTKAPPDNSTKKNDAQGIWGERLVAAKLILNGGAAVEALPKIAAFETDPELRYKIYEDAAKAFSTNNQVEVSLRIYDAILIDDQITPGRKALTATRTARLWMLSNETIRAEKYLDTARKLSYKVTSEEAKTLAESIPLEIESNELMLLYKKGEVNAASVKAEVVNAIYWRLYQEASTPEIRIKTLGNWARNSWDHTRYLIRANRAPEALAYGREVNRLIEGEKISAYSRTTAKSALANALGAVGLYSQALLLADQAVKICEISKEPISSNNCNLARQVRSEILFSLNRTQEALVDVEFIVRARSQSQVIAGNFNQTYLAALGGAAKGDWGSARSAAKILLEDSVRFYGTNHSFTKDRLSLLMLINLRDPAYTLSKAEAENFLASFLSVDNSLGDSTQRGIVFDMIAIQEILQRIIENDGRLGNEDVSELAFVIAEYLRIGVSQSALYDGAAKMAATTPELRALIEKERDQSNNRKTVSSKLNQAENFLKKSSDPMIMERQKERIDEAKKQLAAENSLIKETRDEIGKRFPIYQELSNPRIPRVKELAARLRPDEAYVSLYSGRTIGGVFVVTPDGGLALHKISRTGDATLATVKAYRAPFDAAQVPYDAGKWAGFNVNAAVDLYQSWFSIAMKSLEKVQVLHLAPGGALASVPWSATLTQKPATLESARWFGQEKSIAITPGASSVVLNRTLQTKMANKPFIAFADPLFSKTPVAQEKKYTRAIFTRSSANSFDYSEIPGLPETLDEANAAAMSVGADPAKDVISGGAATRSRVLSEKIDDRRLVEFATHGILPGEIPLLTKPALAMAYEGTGAKESLLTSDDIVTLRLNAEWILLSACNTGLVESGAGDTISGMSRAFFAAGAKSVLATQWAVESESAKALVVNTLTEYSRDATIGKAQALARAQRNMATGKQGGLYRHPYFWAPYFVMGEPHR